MNSPDVAAALCASAPDAAGKLNDAYAEALFQYCWLILRDRQQAKTAVCDALVQAEARVAELSDPVTLWVWLFALVRAECHHHPRSSPGETDEPIARPEQPDAAQRIMAWNSVMSLDLVQREALDLATRHGMTEAEIGLILSLPLPGTTELLATARYDLEGALGAEILVSRDSLECPGRTEAIGGWTGTVTPEFRERLLEHAGSCEVCQPRLPRNVSAGRIFSLLPAPALDGEARGWVIGRVGELIRPRLAEADLAGQELAAPDPLAARVDRVPAEPAEPATPAEPASAASPAPAPTPVATPEMALLPSAPPEETREPAAQSTARAPQQPPRASKPAAGPPRTPPRCRRLTPRIFAGVGAVVVAAGIAAGLAVGPLGSHARLSGSGSRLGGSAAPSQAGAGQADPRPDAPPARPGHGRRSPGGPDHHHPGRGWRRRRGQRQAGRRPWRNPRWWPVRIDHPPDRDRGPGAQHPAGSAGAAGAYPGDGTADRQPGQPGP